LDGGVKDGPSCFWSVLASALVPSAAQRNSGGRMAGIIVSFANIHKIFLN
jgi:hypothetical protein